MINKNVKKLDHTILASGESSGHFHEAAGPDVALYETGPDLWYLDAPAGAEINHQEHGTITLPPGQYDRHIVREYDHFLEESRNVVD